MKFSLARCWSKSLQCLLALPDWRNEIRWIRGQEASLAPPCSKLRSFGSNILYWRKYLWYWWDFTAPGELCPLVTPVVGRYLNRLFDISQLLAKVFFRRQHVLFSLLIRSKSFINFRWSTSLDMGHPKVDKPSTQFFQKVFCFLQSADSTPVVSLQFCLSCRVQLSHVWSCQCRCLSPEERGGADKSLEDVGGICLSRREKQPPVQRAPPQTGRMANQRVEASFPRQRAPP